LPLLAGRQHSVLLLLDLLPPGSVFRVAPVVQRKRAAGHVSRVGNRRRINPVGQQMLAERRQAGVCLAVSRACLVGSQGSSGKRTLTAPPCRGMGAHPGHEGSPSKPMRSNPSYAGKGIEGRPSMPASRGVKYPASETWPWIVLGDSTSTNSKEQLR